MTVNYENFYSLNKIKNKLISADINSHEMRRKNEYKGKFESNKELKKKQKNSTMIFYERGHSVVFGRNQTLFHG